MHADRLSNGEWPKGKGATGSLHLSSHPFQVPTDTS